MLCTFDRSPHYTLRLHIETSEAPSGLLCCPPSAIYILLLLLFPSSSCSGHTIPVRAELPALEALHCMAWCESAVVMVMNLSSC